MFSYLYFMSIYFIVQCIYFNFGNCLKRLVCPLVSLEIQRICKICPCKANASEWIGGQDLLPLWFNIGLRDREIHPAVGGPRHRQLHLGHGEDVRHRDELYKNRSSGKTDSHQEKRSLGSPILLKIVSENWFSGEDLFLYNCLQTAGTSTRSGSTRT